MVKVSDQIVDEFGMKNKIDVNKEILISLREIYGRVLSLQREQASVVSEIQSVLRLIDPSQGLNEANCDKPSKQKSHRESK